MAIKIWKDDQVCNEEKEKEQQQERLNTGLPSKIASWDSCKENIQPIPQGRNMEVLMGALSLVSCRSTRQRLIKERREKFENDLKAIPDDYSKQLDLWSEYIDWLFQNIPDGGKVNGLTDAVEKCIEFYYNKKEFKQDTRLFNVFMKFKRFCDEPIEIFSFMYANSICTLLAKLYIEWSWQYENRKNMTRAEDLIKLGLKNLASPRELLLETQSQLKCRLEKMIQAGELEGINHESSSLISTRKRETQNELANSGIRAALQTLKFRVTKKKSIKVPINRVGIEAVEQRNVGGLKSQTKIVNGIRVPKTIPRSSTAALAAAATTTGATSRLSTSNKPIEVFKDKKRATANSELNANGSLSGVNDENSTTEMDNNNVLANIMPKIATSQRIHSVGRSGAENQPLRSRAFR